MITRLIIINLTAAIFGFYVGWRARSNRGASRPNTSEAILRSLATWVVIMQDRGRDRPADRLAEKVASDMLFAAACLHYGERTDHMDSGAASRWIRARVNELVDTVRGPAREQG